MSISRTEHGYRKNEEGSPTRKTACLVSIPTNNVGLAFPGHHDQKRKRTRTRTPYSNNNTQKHWEGTLAKTVTVEEPK